MTRDDVIDVLTVVAAATRRTVGEADVKIWQEIIGGDDKQLALRGVRDHLADSPGVWLEPGHVHQRVRAYVRDQLQREPDEAREARQEALAAKALEDAEALAERKGLPSPTARQFPRKSITSINPLTVHCPWCRSGIGSRCVIPGTQIELEEHPPMRTGFHPSRVEAAEKAKANA
jgi:hypothetical protein